MNRFIVINNVCTYLFVETFSKMSIVKIDPNIRLYDNRVNNLENVYVWSIIDMDWQVKTLGDKDKILKIGKRSKDSFLSKT